MVAAIVVLYRPDRNALQGLMRSLEDQVNVIFVIDNTPDHELVPEDQLFPLKLNVPLHYTAQGENTGIAAAQNTGIRQAVAAAASHIILFDQDSVPAAGMVQTLLSAEAKLINGGLRVAAVGPVFIDERNGWSPRPFDTATWAFGPYPLTSPSPLWSSRISSSLQGALFEHRFFQRWERCAKICSSIGSTTSGGFVRATWACDVMS